MRGLEGKIGGWEGKGGIFFRKDDKKNILFCFAALRDANNPARGLPRPPGGPLGPRLPHHGPPQGNQLVHRCVISQGILINTRTFHPSGDGLETLLSIFNPFYQTETPHIMSLHEALFPKTYQRQRGLCSRVVYTTPIFSTMVETRCSRLQPSTVFQ